VRVQKRQPKEPDPRREKLCATCGKPFLLGPDEKFFNCPSCHRKLTAPRKNPKRNETQILTQITCQACGAVEYLDFVPTDPATTLCAACFSKKRREISAERPTLRR
jgi:DNA-directed RNA polymerase subunit RPC12/RpoP